MTTVLIADDDAAGRGIYRRVLEYEGCDVLDVNSGERALEILAQQSVDLLLTDVVMPGMSGRQLADTLQPERPDMKVLFLSGYTDDTIVQHGVLNEQVHFLAKPFSHAVLSKKLREVLED